MPLKKVSVRLTKWKVDGMTSRQNDLAPILTICPGPASAPASGQRSIGQAGGSSEGARALRIPGNPER